MIRKTKPTKKVNALKTFGDADYRMGAKFGTRQPMKVGRSGNGYGTSRAKMKK